MSDTSFDTGRAQPDLAPLRSALRALQVPEPDETALREQFRAERKRLAETPASPRVSARRFALAAAATVVTLAGGALLATVMLRDEVLEPQPLALDAPPQTRPAAVGAFQPLPSSLALTPVSAYSVVRVRIPLAAFAVVPGSAGDGTIEADLLVGEDGLARAIRFNEADALRVSVANQ